MIDLQEVSFSYPSPEASASLFRQFNLSIPAGRYVALMGPNGSGKTTLGKIIKGLLSPSSGRVLIGGKALNPGEVSPLVGYIFSNPENQIVSSVVEEDVAFGPGNLGLPPPVIAQRVTESLRRVGMEEYRRHSPHLLSGGQQQKVVIAGILAMESRILVLDEPTSMLDLRDRTEILDLFHQIHQEGERTILHMTHAFEEALRAQDLAYLEAGRITYYGPPGKFLSSRPDALDQVQLPPFIQLIQALRSCGHPVPSEIKSWQELKEFLLHNFIP